MGSDGEIRIPVDGVEVAGTLTRPPDARGVVVFAHGSGSSRHSPRNQMVARRLNGAGFATVLVDLLTPDEDAVDQRTARQRFDIEMLAERVVAATDWLDSRPDTRDLPAGLFGASTGAAAALVAAARRPDRVLAVVSRGGRPDLAGPALEGVRAPTLLLVGGEDHPVLVLNRQAAAALGDLAQLVVIPGASHLFAEPGALEQVAAHAADWFDLHLGASGQVMDDYPGLPRPRRR